jgi:hypothetical protein
MKKNISGKEAKKSVKGEKVANRLEVRRWGDWGTIGDIVDERLN